MAPHSSTLAWKIPWMEEPGRLQSMGSLESDMTERLHFHFSLSCIGEGNGNPLQCSCLENPRDGGAWWAAVYGVAQSRAWLKWLSSSSSRSLVIARGKGRHVQRPNPTPNPRTDSQWTRVLEGSFRDVQAEGGGYRQRQHRWNRSSVVWPASSWFKYS